MKTPISSKKLRNLSLQHQLKFKEAKYKQRNVTKPGIEPGSPSLLFDTFTK